MILCMRCHCQAISPLSLRERVRERGNHFSAGNRRGFTFAELLAAMLFLAIVIPVAVHALTVANRAGTLADRKRTAAQLGNRLLTEAVLTDTWRDAEQEGDFGEDWPRYKWQMADEAWDEDTPRLLTVTVSYTVQQREYSVRLSTLVEETEE